MPVLSVRNLRTEFALRETSVAAVENISFDLEAGECLGIVGESGCGKTTTGLSIMQLLPANGRVSGGQIILDGVDLAQLDDKQMRSFRGNQIALIPQDPLTSLNPIQKIGQQIGEGLRIHRGATKEQARKRAIEVLEMVSMPRPAERLDQYPFELSGGLRQRVMIAMALVCEPKVLIADEPTTALDVTIQAQILDILDRLRAELNMAMILITHDMGVIANRADRVAVMYAGEMIEASKTAGLFQEMRHPYTQSLLASVPVLSQANQKSGSRSRLMSIPGLPPTLTEQLIGCRFAPRCEYATSQCRSTSPDLTTTSDEHSYACFHPVSGPAPVEVVLSHHDATEMQAPTPFLRVENLVKEFPIRSNGVIRRKTGIINAVSDVSFEVGRGETFGLVGESGCGKTTVGRLIVGLEELTGGSVTFETGKQEPEGRAGEMYRSQQRQMMFQDPYSSLDPRQRVEDIVSEPLEIHQIGTKQDRQARVKQLLASVGLPPDAAARYPHEFSGGQRQRIGLARALALNPQLIVADEPVSALDVSIQAQVLNLMQDLQDELGLSYILISHDLAVVQHASDRIGVMYLGKLVEVGPADEVFRNPVHPYTRALIDAVPVPVVDGSVQMHKPLEGEIPSAANPPSGCRFRTRCAFADDICVEVQPEVNFYGDGHTAACHHPLRSPVLIAKK